MMVFAVCSPVRAAEPRLGGTGTAPGAVNVPSKVGEEVEPLAGKIAPGLEEFLAITPADQVVSVLVLLNEQVDLDAFDTRMDQERATLRQRHETIVRSLQETAEATQGDLVARMSELYLEGKIEQFNPYWITNCVRMDATKGVILEIAARRDVMSVYYNYPIELIRPEAVGAPVDPRGGRSPELGVQAVRAPEVWAMGITGDGILVSTLDTGVDGNHPALASRWRGLDPQYAGHPEWAWFDPVTNTTFPRAWGSHGTHTMGTVCGGAPGNEVGVAPGAQWIHAAVIDRVSLWQTVTDAILAFQWLIDPDGDPATNWDVPQVCSNSWGIGSWHNVPPYNSPCDDGFWSYLDACEAAGIVILFSAGNEGPGANTLRRPPDRATDDFRTTAVGGIDANNPPNWTIYTYSSRGPTYCTPTGEAAIKPEIAAPAVNVISSVPGGGYGPMSGTSMASPHVNGVVALIREACPNLGVDEVKQIMYDTALDLGAPGKDNDFGYGLVDAYEAVLLALSTCVGPPRADDGYYETPVDTPVSITLDATDYDGLPDPPGALTYIITSLPDAGNTLTDAGDSHLIIPGDLPYTLVIGGQEVLYTPTGGYYGTDEFEFKANDGGVPPDGGDSNIATISILVLFGPPVITTETLPDGHLNVNYGPVQLGASGGQPALSWEVLTGLPDGLVLSTTGLLSGVPLEFGDFSPTFRVTDSLERSDQREIPLVILSENPDCNLNEVPDTCDVDCDAPECDPPCGGSEDSDGNGTPDECECPTLPTIVDQPVSLTACEGGTATFSVTAFGAPPVQYKWRFNGETIPGAQTSVYTIDPVSSDDEGEYVVIVGSQCGSTFSDVASLTVVTDADCNDRNQCTGDVCTDGACSNPDLPNGTSCNNNDPCSIGETCQGAQCTGGSGVTCPDNGLFCSDASCDPGGTEGNCDAAVPVNEGLDCDDGSACTTSDTCSGGTCTGDSPLDCDDGNPCTNDSCAPASGCVHVNNNEPCADGAFCNGAETCSGGSCQAGEDPCSGQTCDEEGDACVDCLADGDCDDEDDCTVDTCDGERSCTHEYNVRLFGDLVPPFCSPVCPQPDLDDITCIVDDFANGPAVDGCGGNEPPQSTDLAPCGGDGALDLDDILAILDSFSQVFSCPHPCP